MWYFSSRNYIILEDLQYFLPEDKAKKALQVLDVDGDGKISLQDVRDAVIQVNNHAHTEFFPIAALDDSLA